MKKLNQKGFGIVEILLVILLVGLVGGIGYYVYSQAKNNDESSQPQANVSGKMENEAEKLNPEVSYSGSKFTSSNGSYSFTAPDGWNLTENTESYVVYAETAGLTYKPGTPYKLTKTSGGRDGVFGFSISPGVVVLQEKDSAAYKLLGDIKIDGVKATKYSYTTSDNGIGIGPPAGTVTYVYYYEKNGKGFQASYDAIPGQKNQVDFIEKVLKTVRMR